MATAKKARAKAAKAKPAFVSKHPPKQRSQRTLALIERLRKVCLALPDATEQEAWGEPTWRIDGRIFAQCSTYHHGSQHLSVHLPAPMGAQEGLIESDPERFYRPPYVGHRGWVAVVLDTEPDWNMVAALVRDAYDLIGRKRAKRKV